ncbi:MAG: 2-C-methyl-D-erythritol 4-phosphate cytidylyltransferase [Candidatus Neomarinimicrobiota bacterium]
MNISAIITAAGSGQRFGERKQFKLLLGKPLYQYSLEVFIKSKDIDEIIIVVPLDLKESISYEIRKKFNKKIIIIDGGKTRSESVKNGLNVVSSISDLVVIHDAARPFLTEQLIQDSIGACSHGDGAITAISPVDTIKYSRDNIIEKTIDREHIWLAQTPQTFKKDKLVNAYDNTNINNSILTDEACLMENYGYSIIIVPGLENNFKVTTHKDWKRAEILLK